MMITCRWKPTLLVKTASAQNDWALICHVQYGQFSMGEIALHLITLEFSSHFSQITPAFGLRELDGLVWFALPSFSTLMPVNKPSEPLQGWVSATFKAVERIKCVGSRQCFNVLIELGESNVIERGKKVFSMKPWIKRYWVLLNQYRHSIQATIHPV